MVLGPALLTTKDAGDAVTLLQSLAGSTFDSSQLVLTACMVYQDVNETKLEHSRKKRRPDVILVMEERSTELCAWKDSQNLASKLYGFKHRQELLLTENNSTSGSVDGEMDSVPDLKEQVTCLKFEFCKLLQEKRSAVLRAEELETALMEMVKEDNRRLLSVKVEQLEQEISEIQQTLAEKQEKENSMLQVLVRMEQEQKVTEDTRMLAEQDAAAQKYAAYMLQEKYEEIMAALKQMERRAVRAETMLEAKLQNQSSQPSSPARIMDLLSRPFGLGWLDKQKGKPEVSSESKISSDVGQKIPTDHKDINGLQQSDK